MGSPSHRARREARRARPRRPLSATRSLLRRRLSSRDVSSAGMQRSGTVLTIPTVRDFSSTGFRLGTGRSSSRSFPTRTRTRSSASCEAPGAISSPPARRRSALCLRPTSLAPRVGTSSTSRRSTAPSRRSHVPTSSATSRRRRTRRVEGRRAPGSGDVRASLRRRARRHILCTRLFGRQASALTMFALLAISGSQGWSLTKNTALVVLVLLWLATAYWTFKDARRRIADPWLIGVATLVGLVPPFLGPVIYMFFRPPEYLQDARERELEIKAMEERI